MKISSLVILSLFVVGLSLVPVDSADAGEQGNKAASYNAQAGKKGFSGEARNGGWKAAFSSIKEFLSGKPGNHGNAANAGPHGSLGSQGTTLALSASTQNVPVPGTLLLFGGGFVSFALWHHRSRRGRRALDSRV
jgi:hypothetical protein